LISWKKRRRKRGRNVIQQRCPSKIIEIQDMANVTFLSLKDIG